MTFRTLLAGTALALLALPAAAADKELTVFDWAGFEAPAIFQGYVDKHGDSPTYAFFGDDDEAYQKLASGFKADVAHPCSYMVQKYRDAGLIEPWDTSRLPAFSTIEERFLNNPAIRDDKGVWFIPTDWGATGVSYNPDTVPAEDVSTLQVFVNPKYQGRTMLPDSADDVWALAYLATGVSDWTDVTDEQFAAASAWLREAHKNVASYWADPAEMVQQMAGGGVDVAWSWNDGPVLMRKDGYPVGFQREAKEGSSSFYCGFINLKDGPGSEDKVYDFMNAWLEPRAAIGLIENIGYGHTSTEAMKLISDEKKKEYGINPITVPVLSQTPVSPAQRDKQLAEFEKIKAGF